MYELGHLPTNIVPTDKALQWIELAVTVAAASDRDIMIERHYSEETDDYGYYMTPGYKPCSTAIYYAYMHGTGHFVINGTKGWVVPSPT